MSFKVSKLTNSTGYQIITSLTVHKTQHEDSDRVAKWLAGEQLLRAGLNSKVCMSIIFAN